MNVQSYHDELESLLAHIVQDFMQFLHQTGLSGPQIHALLHIYHAGECPISEIGALTGASPAAASQLVERLVQQGWVQRSEDPKDRRIKRVRLTRKSLELIHQGVVSNPFLGELAAGLTAEQHQTVCNAIGYLAQAFHKIHDSHTKEEEQHAQNA
jgi:MarR family 2-MHQ and catechol resistance regulon transcriptional repressor